MVNCQQLERQMQVQLAAILVTDLHSMVTAATAGQRHQSAVPALASNVTTAKMFEDLI
jgi:hypothetical protein